MLRRSNGRVPYNCLRQQCVRYITQGNTADDTGAINTKSKGRIRTTSRFQSSTKPKEVTQKDQPQRKIEVEYVKSPEVIREEIIAKYGSKVPEAFIKEMIDESQLFNATLKLNTREDGTLDVQKYQQEDLKSFLDYIEAVIERFYKELNESEDGGPIIKEDEISFMNKLANMLDPSQMVGNINKSIDSITDKMTEFLRPTAMEDLIALFKAVNENIKKSNRDIPMVLQSRLFNCAIRLPPGEDQDLCLYIAGNLIYLNKGLRADPFNEARYINTLIKNGNYLQLEYLWQSRRLKDVANQRFWDEIGILIYITSKNIRKLESIANEILSKYGYILPTSMIELIKLLLAQKNKKLAMNWVNIFDKMGAEHGFEQNFQHRVQDVDISESDDVDGFAELNKIDKISFEDIYLLVAAFLNVEQYDASFQLTLKYIKLVPNIEEYLLFKYSELPEEIQAGLYYSLTSSKSSKSLQQKLGHVLQISSKSDLELKQMVFKRLLQRKSPLLNADEFNSTLSSEDCYTIIKDFTTRGMHSEVNELLMYMQDVKLALDKDSKAKYLLPPVQSVHYIPVLQKLGRHKSKEVVVRAEKLLLIMNKVGVTRGQYFHTQYLLTLYRKREFQKCFDYINENFIQTNDLIKSFVLLDTIWAIYRDSNRSERTNKGIRLTSEDINNLVQFSLRCYDLKPPSVSGVSLVIETLLATKNFPLVMVYIQSLTKYDNIKLDQPGFLKLHNVLLELSLRKDLAFDNLNMELRDKIIGSIQENKVNLLTQEKQKIQTQFQTYDLENAYFLIYHFYKLFWNIDTLDIEAKNVELANELGVEFAGSENIIAKLQKDNDKNNELN